MQFCTSDQEILNDIVCQVKQSTNKKNNVFDMKTQNFLQSPVCTKLSSKFENFQIYCLSLIEKFSLEKLL